MLENLSHFPYRKSTKIKTLVYKNIAHITLISIFESKVQQTTDKN